MEYNHFRRFMHRYRHWLYILLVVVLAGQALCQTQGFVLLGLTIEGNITADQGLIKANSGLMVGRQVSGEDIQAAIKQLWKLELFSDIEILLDRQVADGVYLTIRVVEYPRLEKVLVSGEDKIDKDDIMDAVDLLPGQVLRPNQVLKVERSLKKLYAEKGFLLAKIDIETKTVEDADRIVLLIDIDEGKKVKIKRVRFIGNEEHEQKKPGFPLGAAYWTVDWMFPDNPFCDSKLRKRLKGTKQKGFLRSGEFKEDKFAEDLESLEKYYHDLGYRDMEVVKDSIYYSDDLKRMFIDIFIDEGSIYYFGDVTFLGNTLFTEEELAQKLLFKTGDVFSQEKLQLSAQERIGGLYYDLGYIYSSVMPMETPVGSDTMAIHFNIVEGNQFNVRMIHFTGNTKTKEKVIRREFVLKPGDTFDVSKLRRSIREVTILNYFANIVPDVQTVSEDEVDLYIDVEEKSTDQAQMSAGYSERDGMIGALGFTMNNLFGNGQRVSLDWNFGKIYRQFSLSFTEPWFMDTPTLLGASFFHIKRGGTYYGYTERIIGGTLRFGRRFRWPDDYFRGDWIYRLEETEYANFSTAFAASNPRGLLEDVPRISSGLTQIITRDSRDNPEFPTEGSVNAFSTEMTGGIFGGDDQYHKHMFSSEWYIPVFGGMVLYCHSKMGLLSGLTGNPLDIPYVEHFFMGGSGLQMGEPLRGYDERQVGPMDQGYPAGGKTMFKQTFEIRFPLVDSPTVYGLVFAEGGNCYWNFEKTDPFNLRRSVGLGIRLFMPLVGLIGLDYGYGIDYYNFAGERQPRWVPHFQFGRGF
ncbi:MAG: outer membrane protein assembly factor BamA [candidate division Zixibacteria bacterium]|nr:outer membrane protein assembly factor BamA [Candidatus Tariuqbacter arcticus]